MFDIGFWELVILFGLGLLVLGPERMPQVVAKLGRWAGQARSMARNLTRQFREELEPLESVRSNLDQAMRTDYSAMRPDVGDTPATEAGADANSPDQSDATNNDTGADQPKS